MKQKGLLATLGILAIAALLVSPIMGHAAGKRMSIGGAYYAATGVKPPVMSVWGR